MVSATSDRRRGLTGDKGMKAPVDLATTGNITLSGEQSIDGTLTASSRVLVKNQSDTTQNGVYDSSSGAWTRAIDANGNQDLVKGTQYLVTDGTQAYQVWVVTSPNRIIPGTSAITFSQSLSAGFVATLLAAAGASLVGYIHSAAAAVARTVQSRLREVAYLSDFGAYGDGTVQTAAIQAAVTWATTTTGRKLRVSAGTYIIDGAITKAQSFIGLDMEGESANYCVFQFTTAAGFVLVGGSGGLCNSVISNCAFTGVAGVSVAITFQGICGQKVKQCTFDTMLTAALMHNKIAGEFTEYCTLHDCNFAGVDLPLEYRRTAGDDSFNGSGLTGVCTARVQTVLLQIGEGCKVYNAPINVQVWGLASCVLFVNLNTTRHCTFYGHITIEVTAGTTTLASSASAGRPVPFAGPIIPLGDNVTFGTLFQCDYVAQLVGGGLQIRGARWAHAQAMSAAANTVIPPAYVAGSGCMVSVRLTGANYEYRYLVGMWNTLSSGLAPIIATFATFNGAARGAPAFTIDGSNNLVITNANYLASDVIARIDMVQVAQSPDYAFVS